MLDEKAIATTGLNSACILTSFKGLLKDLPLHDLMEDAREIRN